MHQHQSRTTRPGSGHTSPESAPAKRNDSASPLSLRVPGVQTKLAVNDPGDRFEEEADTVADAVMRAPLADAPGIQRQEQPEDDSVQLQEQPDEAMLQRDGDGKPGVSSQTAATIRAPGVGDSLPASTRSRIEPHVGADLSDVQVHTDTRAAEAASSLQARAFTYNNHIFLNSAESASDVPLIAHESAHVVQQDNDQSQTTVQRQSQSQRAAASKVVIVGSPSPGEIRANHPLQFAHAAQSFGVDEDTLWLVERTGYELGGISLSSIEQLAAPGRIEWITPANGLIDHLNRLPASSIRTFHVYSHGVPGNVTLRYGWPGRPNYGLSIPGVRSMRGDLFAPDAQIRFDSCNTGTSDWYSTQGNVAQSFAEESGRPVEAWTGRTSYTEVNQSAGTRSAQVVASEKQRGIHIDWAEVASQVVLGRTPELQTFHPVGGNRVGGFVSTFQIRVRLPESRTFEVPAQGAVVVTCNNTRVLWSEAATPNMNLPGVPQAISIALHRERFGLDADYDVRAFPVAPVSHREVWSNLEAGIYYVEIWRHGNPGLEVAGNIVVDVHAHQ